MESNLRNRGQRVLIATSTGAYRHATVCDGTIAQALSLRGASVDYLLCDGVLPACQLSKVGRVSFEALAREGQEGFCEICIAEGQQSFVASGFPVHKYGTYISPQTRSAMSMLAASVPLEEIPRFNFEGLSLGEHAYAGALRYFARGDLKGEPFGEAILRHYLTAALVTATAFRHLLRTRRYDVVVAHHGIYVPQGILCEVARQEGVRVVTWNPAYRKHTFIFSHLETYHHSMISEPLSAWENLSLTEAMERETLLYINSRRLGTNDWIWFHDKPQEDILGALLALGLDKQRPYIALLTSVVWDAQLHYKANAFPNMLTWIFRTIEYFQTRPDLQLVIRVHPAEIRGSIPSRQKAVDEISLRFPRIPPNVFLVGPDDQISTYALAEGANAILIYNTKTGIEVSSLGLPVIVAGEAWIRGKGFSLDASNPADYTATLDKLPLLGGLDKIERARAIRYAYHFFFRRMIPLPFIREDKKFNFVTDIRSIAELEPGHFKGLDVICNGILLGSPFIYPAEYSGISPPLSAPTQR